MQIDPKLSAIEEIKSLKTECLTLLRELKDFCPPDSNQRFPDTFRLIATPMLYSTWERCFTLCHAVGLRLVREMSATCNALDPPQKAAWLLGAPFYQSFTSRNRNQGQANAAGRNKVGRGHFDSLTEFIAEFNRWVEAPLDRGIDTDELVMAASNVNKEVVQLNARALGIADYEPFKQLKLDQLDELVGRRNEVGHGATLQGPSNPDFNRLWQFTETLIADYCEAFISYFQKRFP